MKLIIDAQLPRRLASLLRKAGHDVRHTLDLPLRNTTPDALSTGNLRNDELLGLFEQHFGQLADAFQHHSYIELSRSQFTIHQ